MGGREYAQRGRRGRSALRRAVVLAVLGALAGALFLCARPGGSHSASVSASEARAHGAAHAVCVSPYDLPGCTPLAHVTAAVLPVPPPAVTVPGGGAPPAAQPAAVGRIRPPEALARAPDLHVLQVLRT
ncbi:hypothetical protein AVW11_11980 [Streptomyces amritsarensis]|uniref:Secreted protein n=1 Tax=Streptomyces amritsarensis TaxID=681158 RepID=A0ABX3G4E3_9ACTN|nr:hypothetical protein [Streptomyces amritsarensis]OLZ68727.1 hypothetical protein AVW11_11980 [Streptomyces amritsarensis]